MIINYHHVASEDYILSTKDSLNDNSWYWTIAPDELSRHIEILKKKKYSFLGLDEYYEYLQKNACEKFKTAVITFDDGWLDNYLFAFPLLQSYNIRGTFFVTTAHLEKDNAEQKISKEMIFEMHNNGMIFGSHTINHLILPLFTDEEVEKEVKESKTTIEKIINNKVRFFAYPGGAFNSKIIEIVKNAGYEAACSIISPATNKFNDRFYLFRNYFSNQMNTLSDYYRLNKHLINLFEHRSRNKLYLKIQS